MLTYQGDEDVLGESESESEVVWCGVVWCGVVWCGVDFNRPYMAGLTYGQRGRNMSSGSSQPPVT